MGAERPSLRVRGHESPVRVKGEGPVIKLVVRPADPPWTWDRFIETAPRFSIALDGFVRGGPRFSEVGPHVNFNHHEDVDRIATRATCGQVLMALRQGFFEMFRDVDGPQGAVHVNDCDEDVCTSWYLLVHHFLCEQPMQPRINRLVSLVDTLDATAGAYPFPLDMPALRELAWIFEPYRQFRLSGEIDKRVDRAFRSVIEDVTLRIEQHVMGNGKELPIDTRYERIGGGSGWAMVREVGAQAKTGIFNTGIRAYVSVRDRPDGRFTYVVGRMSPFIRFDIDSIFRACNQADGDRSDDAWGGSNTIGGSPRVRGSGIRPEEMEKIVDAIGREKALAPLDEHLSRPSETHRS